MGPPHSYMLPNGYHGVHSVAPKSMWGFFSIKIKLHKYEKSLSQNYRITE